MPTDFGPIIRQLYISAAGQLPDDLCVLIADYAALSPREKLAQLVINTHVGDFIFLRQIPAKLGGTVAFGIRKSVSGRFVFIAIPDAWVTIRQTESIGRPATRQLSDFEALVRCIARSEFSLAVADWCGLNVADIFTTTFEAGLRAEFAIKEVIIPPRPSLPRVRQHFDTGDVRRFLASTVITVIVRNIAGSRATG